LPVNKRSITHIGRLHIDNAPTLAQPTNLRTAYTPTYPSAYIHPHTTNPALQTYTNLHTTYIPILQTPLQTYPTLHTYKPLHAYPAPTYLQTLHTYKPLQTPHPTLQACHAPTHMLNEHAGRRRVFCQ